MDAWNGFFRDEKNIKRAPEAEVFRFVTALEDLFLERPLRIWDVCCGAGRHTVAVAKLGHQVSASDSAPAAVGLTRKWLTDENLQAQVELADMTVCPWPEATFHGVISWDALYHNTLGNIRVAVDEIQARLAPGGLFMGTFKSIRADLYGEGDEIEPGTFVCPELGAEKDIPHRYFDESGMRELFKNWEILSLAEQVITYVVRGNNFPEYNPFPYTTWGVLARKSSL